MIHLFQHKKDGKFDIALVVRGKYIIGSNQHYERKSGCYRAIKSILSQLSADVTWQDTKTIYFQDDTLAVPKIYFINGVGQKTSVDSMKPSKPYVPNKK